MKKFLYTILANMMMYSCSNEVDLVNNEIQSQEIEVEKVSNNVTLEDIHAYMQQDSKIASRNSTDGTIKVITQQNEIVMYLLNYGNGWEVMPGDKRFPLQIAFNENGNLDFDNLNDTQRAWFTHMAEKIHTMKLYGDTVQTVYTKIWDKYTNRNKKKEVKSRSEDGGWVYHNTRTSTSTTQKSHLINTLWDQRHPYNMYCPPKDFGAYGNKPTGCVATAAGQVLLYMHNRFGKPYTTPSQEHYDVINKEYSFSNWTSSEWTLINQNDSNAVARLLGNIGVLSETKYTNSYSESDFLKLKEGAFSQYGINCDVSGENWSPNILVDNIDNEKPVIGGIFSKEPTAIDVEGHAVIIDGYRKETTTYTDIYIYVNDLNSYPGDIYDHEEGGDPLPEEGPTREETYYSTSIYYMLNWGWGVIDNSYYYSNNNIPDILEPNSITYRRKEDFIYNLR